MVCKIFGHKFQPRYDYEPATSVKTGEGPMSEWAFERLLEATMRRTYIYDVCVRCGEKITKNTAEEAL